MSTRRPPSHRGSFRRLTALVALAAAFALIPSSPGLSISPAARPDPATFGEDGSGPAAPWVEGRGQAVSASASDWDDVGADHWAKVAIDRVALQNDWMNDFGDTTFQPDAVESRKLFARALVMAFAPDEPIKPSITFNDLPADDPFYPYANVAVKKRWMTKFKGNFNGDRAVKTIQVHRALVYALGLKSTADAIDGVSSSNGYVFVHKAQLGSMNLGMHLYLRYNHPDESLDVGPYDKLSRAEVAWSLYRADVLRTTETWRVSSMSKYDAVELGFMGPKKRAIVDFGLAYVGYPYVWAGEWASPTPAGYCCGAQPVGGFDCSGLMWWLVRAPSGSWDNRFVRPFYGWSLPERSSRDMSLAVSGADRLTYQQATPGDLMFYDGDGNGVVDHVNLYLGRGWALDSSSGVGGVTLLRVADGWYRDHFVWARRIT